MKSSPAQRFGLLSLALLLAASAAVSEEIPLRNWTVPPYQGHSASGGMGTMGVPDLTPGTSFVGVTPCRLVDTRPAAAFPAGYGVPAMAAGAPRNFDLNSAAHCSGIPAGVEAYSLNITVTETLGSGFILIFPQGGAQPNVSTLNYLANQTVANAAIVPAGTSGGITVIAGVSGTHLIIDINGFFTDELNSANAFVQVGNIAGLGIGIFINSANTGNSSGVVGVVGPGFADNQCCGPTGVIGRGAFAGVAGSSQDRGTVGLVVNTAGNLLAEGQLGKIGGSQTQAFGVNGFTLAAVNADDSAAVKGDAFATSGRVYGGRFYTASNTSTAAGVIGFAASGFPHGGAGPLGGGGRDTGVVGTGGSGSIGVQAIVSDSASSEALRAGMYSTGGVLQTQAYLAYSSETALLAIGDVSKSGSVSFVEPHSSDPTKMVRYVSLEGNEAGTYFRGRGKFQNGLAVIEIPEDFRMVTAPEGLSIQVTPIGEMASVAVASIGLDRIVVKGSRNVEFFYTVNGVRRGYGDFRPIVDMDKTFIPQSPDAVMPEVWNGEIRNRLIANGIYKPDGTVNMETAERLGWTAKWEAEKRVPVRVPMSPEE